MRESCKETIIDGELALKLQVLHDALLYPIHITSGFRCKAHQDQMRNELKEDGTHKYETAVGQSTHEQGRAADIRTNKHTGIQLEEAARKAGFRSIGVASTWVHVDTRSDKTRSWNYK